MQEKIQKRCERQLFNLENNNKKTVYFTERLHFHNRDLLNLARDTGIKGSTNNCEVQLIIPTKTMGIHFGPFIHQKILSSLKWLLLNCKIDNFS